MPPSSVPVILFGYDSSAFTHKIRYVLKCKQIPYTFVKVPSMMPRPVLRDNFHLTYRKIPVLGIGRELYCDTSLIAEALEHFFPESGGYPSIYPRAADGRDYRPMMRSFASFWIDRPFFRVTTGLIPGSVWRTSFGQDRSGLIGHKLDPDKLEAKLPRNYSNLDMQLSMLEPLFKTGEPWIFSSKSPSLADISLYYQLQWGTNIAAGRGMENLTAGGLKDTNTEGASTVFNATRYPALHKWFQGMTDFLQNLPSTETVATTPDDTSKTLQQIKNYVPSEKESSLLPTPSETHFELDRKNGLVLGTRVSVAPDDTGRDDPTLGTLVALSPEEVVIKPDEFDGKPAPLDIRVHFPKLGFVVKPVQASKL